MKYCLIAFESTHAAITTEKHLKKLTKISIMPTLREISSGCGKSIKFSYEDLEIVLKAMNDFHINKDLYKIYEISTEYNKIRVTFLY